MNKVLSITLSLSIALSSVNGFAQEKVEAEVVSTTVNIDKAGKAILAKIAEEEALIKNIRGQIENAKLGQGAVTIELPNEILFSVSAAYGINYMEKLDAKFAKEEKVVQSKLSKLAFIVFYITTSAFVLKTLETFTVFYIHEADIVVLNSKLEEADLRLQLLKESIVAAKE